MTKTDEFVAQPSWLRQKAKWAGRKIAALKGWLRRRFRGREPGPEIRHPGPGRFLEGHYAGDAGTLTYKLFLPRQRSHQPPPLVVMLHGCTQTPDDFAACTRMNELAEEFGVLVLYPAQAESANRSRCWNWFNPEHQQRDRGEPSLIAGMTRQVATGHGAHPGRIYVAGLSAGGAAAAVLGSTYPDIYAAVGIHSGMAIGTAGGLLSAFFAMRFGALPQVPLPGGTSRMVPTIVFHGDKDPHVHPRNADRIIADSRAATSCPPLTIRTEGGQAAGGHTYRRVRHMDASGRTLLEQWTIHGSGHAWSGGCGDGPFVDPLGPDAGREMLRFFLEHGQ